MLRLECDRCKVLSKETIEPVSMPRDPDDRGAPAPPAIYGLPDGWKTILGKHCCKACVRDVEFTLNCSPGVRA